MDRQLITLIENFGYINKHGQRVYGTAALLHYTHVMNCPIKNLDPCMIGLGKVIVEKCLCA